MNKNPLQLIKTGHWRKEWIELIVETTKNFVIITAENKKVFKDKVTGDVLTDKLYLGCNDSSENYEEVEVLLEEVIYDISEEQESTSIQT